MPGTHVTCPDGLHFSERKLWDECPQARDVLARLARYRAESGEAAYDRWFTLGERIARSRLNVAVFAAGTILWGACALTSGGVWWSQAAQVLLAMLFAFMLGATLFSRRPA